jgi:predicted GNAT family N-acyltransferase
MGAFEIRRITAAETIPLRHSVLRPGRPVEQAHFPGDDDPRTAHFGGFKDGHLLCVASLFASALPGEERAQAFQLRGMAADPVARGLGLGTALVKACAQHAGNNRAKLLWCNARTSAAGFYSRLGFEIVGNEFDIPDVGPHFRMRLPL